MASLAAAVVAVAALTWRLGRGPISLPFLTTQLERAFSKAGQDTVARVGRAELAWTRHRPEIRVLDVELSRGGIHIATFPQLSVWPSLRAASRGELAIARVALSGARIALMRAADGSFTIGSSGNATNEATFGLLAALARERSSGHPGHLSVIEVYDAQVVLDDRATDAVWRAEPADVTISVRSGGFSLRLTSDFAFRSPTNAIVRELDMPLVVSADMTIDERRDIMEVAFDLRGVTGRILTAADTKTPTALHAVNARGSYSQGIATLKVDHFSATVGTAPVEAVARVPVGVDGVAEIDGTLGALRASEITRFWPPTKSHKVRAWIEENIHGGAVPSCDFKLRIPISSKPDGPRVSGDDVDVSFAFEGLTVDYLHPLEPVHSVHGKGRVTADRFDAVIDGASLMNLAVSNGKLGIDFKRGIPDPALATIAIDVSGPTGEMLALIDDPPLEVTRKLGLRTDAGGESEVHTELRLPLDDDIKQEDVHVTADAKVRAARLADIVAGIGIDDGDLHVRVHDRRFHVAGSAMLTNAPALTGPADITLSVDPEPGAGPTRLTGAIETPELAVEGDVVVAEKRLRSAALSSLRYGHTNVSADVTHDSKTGYRVKLAGETLDLEPLLKRMKEEGESPLLAGVAWAVDFDVARMLTGRAADLSEVRGTCRGDSQRLEALHASGKLPDSGALQIDMETSGGERHVTFSSDQGGKVLEALGINERIQGGTLSFAAKMDDQGFTRSGEGLLELNNFRVLEAPLLAKILSLGSLDGIASLLGREGIGFTGARIPLAWRDGTFEMRDARAVGALGITADGTIDQNSDVLDIQGEVIPAYTLNSALGKVPVIGNFLVGGEGKGVFGFNYSVGGTTDEPKVSVNPISVLAPGVLKQMFVDPFRTKPTRP